MKTLLHTLIFVLCSASLALAQQRAVTGTVTDNKGESLVGATILVKGTTTATSANADGSFQLSLPEGATTLVVSFVGSKSQEVVVGDQTTLRITLAAAEQSLDDVVVIGYGTARKSDLTGAVVSVRSEQLTQVATADPVQALQGRAAGVEITSNSGQPGSGTRIRVRGVGTINNSNPLYVVDGFQTGDINFLLPSDIESIEILKDASATAIYGSRGANGVVLVTTKKGKVGQTQFSLNGYAGYQELRRKLDVTNAAQYATLVTEAYRNDGLAVPTTYGARLQDAINTNAVGTDWQQGVTQRGLITNYNLSVSGGTEQNRFLVSAGYFQQDGVVKYSGLRKYVVRLNDELVLSKRVKAGVSANFTRSNSKANLELLRGAALSNPVIPVRTTAGDFAFDDISTGPNVARQVDEQLLNTNQNTNLLANTYVDVTLIKGLSFRSNFGINYNNAHPKIYLPQFFVGITDQRSLSSLSETRAESVGWVWSNFLNYSHDFGSDHNISATLGQEAQRSSGNGLTVTAFDVPADASLQYLSASRSNMPSFASAQFDQALLSFFGRANYSYKGKYLLTGTMRYDGSSKFLPSNRWGIFPSVGAAWRISDEAFLKEVPAVTSLKLRAGWGQVGNQNAEPNYGFATVAVNNQNYSFANVIVPGQIPTQLSNPNLKWETAVSTNVGVDAEFFNGHLVLTADYFIKKTERMIALLPVPDFIGAAPASANVASMQNKGIELALNYRNEAGKFRYDVGINFTHINNKVTDLGGADPIASGNIISQMGNTTLTDVGREIAYFYGLQTNGIFHTQAEIDAYRNANNTLVQPNAKPGDVRFVDRNGDGKITALDKTYLGSASNPSFTYGASLSLGYGSFDFKVLLYGVQGVEAVNGLGRYLSKTSNSTGNWNNFYASRLDDRWTPTNTGGNQPRMTTLDRNGNDQFSDRFVENASYLRARNMELGYSLTKSLASRYHVGGIRVYASVDNVFTLTKYTGFDPEISEAGFFGNPLAYGVDFGNYPQPRTYRLGFNVQF